MPVSKIRQIDALTDLHKSIDAFRSESGANFSELIGGQKVLIKATTEKQYESAREQFKPPPQQGGAAGAAGGAAGVASGAKPKEKGGIGIPKGAGKGLAALAGVGIGLAGLGALFAGGGYLIKQLAEFDGKAVKENILTLLTIPSSIPGDTGDKAEAVFGTAGALAAIGAGLIVFSTGAGMATAVEYFERDWASGVKKNIGTLLTIFDLPNASAKNITGLAATLGAIGLGLLAFNAGAATGVAVQGIDGAISKFQEEGWAQKTVDQVETLLSIMDLDNVNIKDVTGFAATMGAIGLGLLAFNAGAASGVAVQGIGTAVKGFGEQDFAQKTYDQVKTLLSIMDLENVNFKDVAAFPLVMAAVGLGLLAFNAGKASGVVVGGMADAVTAFTGSSFAEKIKEEVKVLLSILDLPGVTGANVIDFGLTMGGIGLGLLAFSIGKGANAAATGAAEGISQWTSGTSFADKVYNEVEKLLSITELSEGQGDEKTGKVGAFLKTMAGLSAGLLLFSAGEFVGSLANAGASIVGFLTGSVSPFTQISKIADDADKLDKGATAIEKLAGALANISGLKFSGKDMHMEDFAKDLAKSVPAIEAAIMGGEIDGGWFGLKKDIVFKGLASPDIKFADAAANIKVLREAISGANKVDGAAAESSGGGGGTVINNIDNSVTNNNGGGGGGGDINMTPSPGVGKSENKGDHAYDMFAGGA